MNHVNHYNRCNRINYFFASVLALLLLLPLVAQAHPLDTLPPGHWYAAPNSRLDAIQYPWPPEIAARGARVGPTWFPGIMRNWSGGAYDTKRERLIIWGGGHAGYAGNEIYVFDMATLQWIRVNTPGHNVEHCSPCIATSTGAYLDAQGQPDPQQPRARHTYQTIHYIPTIDRFCGLAGTAHYPDAHDNWVHCFDFETNRWERKANAQSSHGFSGFDPHTGLIWVRGAGSGSPRIATWNPVTDTWTSRSGPTTHYEFNVSGAIDTRRRRFIAVGAGKSYKMDIAGTGNTSVIPITTTGDTTLVRATSPGFEYVPDLDLFVGWSGGSAVYTLHPETFGWTKILPAPSNTVSPATAQPNGTYGRWRYSAKYKAFVLANYVDHPVLLYRLGGTAAPPPQALAPPRALKATMR